MCSRGDHDGAMTDAPPPDDATVTRARLQGKRVALGVVIAVALIFIGASAMQIIPAVFGFAITPVPPAPPGSSARACADGMRRLLYALDGASAQALTQAAESADEAALQNRLRALLSPAWDTADEVRAACQASSAGLDAWAALMRMRSGVEQVARQGRIVLAPLRRDVLAHLSADLR
jgi:hypothetical protein